MTNKEKLEAIEKIVYSDGEKMTDGECIDAVIGVLTQLGAYERIVNRELLIEDMAETLANMKDISYMEALPLITDDIVEITLSNMYEAETEVLSGL